jgi:hypothetical protein
MKKTSIFAVLLILLAFVACKESNMKPKPIGGGTETLKKAEKPAFAKATYIKKGKEIAKTTFLTFKSKLEGIAKQKGLVSAVVFCNENAKKLADSIGKANNVEIRRTSHKLRNSESKPNPDQEAVINNYLQLQEDPSKPMEPVVMKDEKGLVHFYAPIKLKKDCLKCHGQPETEIHADVYKAIKKNYPNDKAINFKEGELRGIWDIKFLK